MMAVTYLHREPPASQDLVSHLEQRTGRSLPTAYRGYLLDQNGGRLASNDEAVNTVFGLGDVPDWANMWRKLDNYRDRMPTWLLPVANDEYGNLFAISLRDSDFGSVWFWDHEEEADEGEPPSEDNLEWKAPDWLTFLDGLRPVDEDTSP
jgi:cell wall assembly regulator SMI1